MEIYEEKEKGTEAGAATPYRFQKDFKGKLCSASFSVTVSDKEQASEALSEFSQKCRACYLEMAAELNKDRNPDADQEICSSRLEIHPTKESAEQASREFFAIQQRLAEQICAIILEKIGQKADLAEINDMIRSLSHFEATGTLPNPKLVNTVANKYADYVEGRFMTYGKHSGDTTCIITDAIRCIHRLNDIIWNMRNQTIFRSETSDGAS